MKTLHTAIALACLPVMVAAQDPSPDDSPSMMKRGAQMFMEGLLQEMAPAVDGLSELGEKLGPALRSFTDEMGPAFADLLNQVEDWSVYEAPEKLPNGDIIIRRKPEPAPESNPEDAPPVILLDETPQIEI